MTDEPPGGALRRVRTFWGRILSGPPAAARIEIYEELAPSLAAGIGVREALDLAAGRHAGKKRRAVDLLADGVARDVPMSETMRGHPEAFSVLEAAILSSGERTGRLDVAFRTAAAQLDRQRATQNRLIQACTYPFVLLHCLILIPSLGLILPQHGLLGWLAFVIPALATLWLVLLGGISFVAAYSDRPAFARFAARIPIVGRAVTSSAIARFARSLGALHGAGVTYDESLRIAAETSGNALLMEESRAAVLVLRTGGTFPDALGRLRTIPHEDQGLLLAGEQSGELEASAKRVAELEEERFEVVTKRAIAVLPTVLVGIVGLAVAVIAFRVIGGYYKSLTDMLR